MGKAWNVQVQSGHIEAKLEDAWAALGGRACRFTRLAEPPALMPGDALYILPISNSGGAPAAAVMLLLGPNDAHELAGAMFGQHADALSPADLQDAGAELCNIFSGCLIDCLGDSSHSELGLPLSLSPWRYPSLLKQGVRQTFQCLSEPDRRLAVLWFDRMPELS